MRILQICSAREVGGGERHLADLANELARRSHEVFAALSPASPVTSLLSALSPANIIELPMRNALNLASAMKLSRFVKEQGIDIVHAHVARDYPLAALATGRTNAQLVLTRHVLFPLSRIHRLTLRRTARVIAVSQAVAESVCAARIFDDGQIVLIHNGIDVARFANSRKSAPASSEKVRVGMTGHLAPIKGQEDFIRAAQIVCQNRSDIEFVIAGEDKSRAGENRRALEQLILELGLEGSVKLLGWVDDVPAILSSLDLFVSPSRAEPFGLAIIEAMAAGVPIIATNSEGAREILEDNETGRLISIGDPKSLATAITNLLAADEERARLVTNASRVVRERFSLEQMVEKTEQVYEAALADRA